MITLEHVTREFKSGCQITHAVQDVSLHVERGMIFGIIGLSGAGKSTLVRCMNLLERPDSGRVLVGGTDIMTLRPQELREKRRKIGIIFQQFNLFASRSVFGNVAYPLQHSGKSKEEIYLKVEHLLELVGLSEKAEAYPSELSGGQKQRVAIARALANDPEILLCDEATSALDPQTTKSILKLLKELNHSLGLTIVVVTHEMDVIKEICDQVAVMENGQVAEQGEIFQIFAAPDQPVTKSFVDGAGSLGGIQELLEDPNHTIRLRPGEQLMRFGYRESDISEALISYISREYQLDVNILFGNIELIKGRPLGGIIAIVRGTTGDIKAATRYLQQKNVVVEVIWHGKAA